jgi:hypothetical protein
MSNLPTFLLASALMALIGVPFVSKVHSERLRRWLVRFAWVLFIAGMIAYLVGEATHPSNVAPDGPLGI